MRERKGRGPGKPADPLAALGFGRKPPAQLLNLLGVLEASVDPTLGELHWRSGDALFREKNLLHCLDQMPLCEPTDPMTLPMQFLFLLPGRKMTFTSYDGGLSIHFQREVSIEARRSSEGQPPQHTVRLLCGQRLTEGGVQGLGGRTQAWGAGWEEGLSQACLAVTTAFVHTHSA